MFQNELKDRDDSHFDTPIINVETLHAIRDQIEACPPHQQDTENTCIIMNDDSLVQPPAKIQLLCIADKPIDMVYYITKMQTLIGRSPECNIYIPDMAVSSKHVLIDFDGGRLYISDAESRNGTFVNGNKLTSTLEITSDIDVRIGRTTLKIIIS